LLTLAGRGAGRPCLVQSVHLEKIFAMTVVPNSFIKRLPTATPGLSALVKIVPMQFSHAVFWHAHVQPIVDELYTSANSLQPAADVRADIGWDWSKYFALMALHNSTTLFPTNGSGIAQGFALVVEGEEGVDVPIGLLTMVPRFDTTVRGFRRERTFAWYLSDAPSEFYQILGLEPLKLVAKALLDTSLQAGRMCAMDGEFLLHADPAGGKKLLNFYENSCKMTAIAPSRARISFFRPGKVGGYFLFTASQSANFSAQFDPYR